MRGPNYWSVYRHKLIVMKLDLEELEELPTNKIPGFSERLEVLLPGLYKHRCSEGVPGGFFTRVKEGTWMGHVIEHLALELQTLAGMVCGYGRTRSTETPGVYNVVYSYIEENAGIYAGKAAIRITKALIAGEDYNLEKDINILNAIREREALGPSTAAIVEEATNRGIPYLRLNKRSLVMLGYGVNQKRIQSTICSTTGNIAVDIACDKEETKNFLEKASIPVPKGIIVYDELELKEAINTLGFPLVVKPVNGNHGRGITININSQDKAIEALALAREISNAVIVERFIQGFDFRFLVINYKLVAAAKRTPAYITGDGKSTIAELIELTNQDERRGNGHSNVLTKIEVDAVTESILREKELTLSSVLKKEEILYLKDTANISTGGTATDVTDIVHPSNALLAERISRLIGLDICGIDIMAPSISTPIVENGGVVLEVNAAPGFRMHLSPTHGLPRNVAAPVIDMLFPKGSSFDIPIVAVTGTNGKTTTTRLIAHIMSWVGNKVGYTTTDGIYIQGQLVEKGDCTGPLSTEYVLKDPTVNFAVMECARGGIIRAGLGFSQCDIGIITNISDDHLGQDDIESIEGMARIKAVVAESVKYEGAAILNADDDLCFDIRHDVEAEIVLFSTKDDSPRIKKHCKNGGLAAIVENGFITICKGNWKIRVEEVRRIPLAFNGKAEFMVQNILAAVLTAYIRNVEVEDIREALHSFIPSPEQTPGRLNLFHFRNYDVLIDYAHNTHGFKALGNFIKNFDCPKVGIVAAVGDRRDEDLRNIGRLASEMFDEVIIRQDKDLRGRSEEQINNLVLQGLHEKGPKPVKLISNEIEALTHAIEHAAKGSMIVLCSDNIQQAIYTVQKLRDTDLIETKVSQNKVDWTPGVDQMTFIKY